MSLVSNTTNIMPWQNCCLKAVENGLPFDLSHQIYVSPALKCAVILKWHTFLSDKWTQNHYTNYEAGKTSNFDSFLNPQMMICKGNTFWKLWQFFFLLISNTVKWKWGLSICQICLCPSNSNVAFYEDSDGESREKSFWFLRVFIFNHVRTMLNP